MGLPEPARTAAASYRTSARPRTKPIHVINTTLFTPRDSSGYQYWEWQTRWIVQNYVKPNPSIAGLFEDAVFWKPRVDADWNRDGVIDSKDSANAGKWLREGYRQRFALHAPADAGQDAHRQRR